MPSETPEAASVQGEKVWIGSAAVVTEESGAERRYTILGPWDTDFERGIISYLSPIAQALLGKTTGDRVKVRLPDGETVLEVKSTVLSPQVKGGADEPAEGA